MVAQAFIRVAHAWLPRRLPELPMHGCPSISQSCPCMVVQAFTRVAHACLPKRLPELPMHGCPSIYQSCRCMFAQAFPRVAHACLPKHLSELPMHGCSSIYQSCPCMVAQALSILLKLSCDGGVEKGCHQHSCPKTPVRNSASPHANIVSGQSVIRFFVAGLPERFSTPREAVRRTGHRLLRTVGPLFLRGR